MQAIRVALLCALVTGCVSLPDVTPIPAYLQPIYERCGVDGVYIDGSRLEYDDGSVHYQTTCAPRNGG